MPLCSQSPYYSLSQVISDLVPVTMDQFCQFSKFRVCTCSSPSMMLLRAIHIIAKYQEFISFYRRVIFLWLYHNYIHSPRDGYLNGFQLGGLEGFPCGSDGKESACNVGDLGWIPASGRSPGKGNGLENSKNRGAWRATVHGVAESWTLTEWLMWTELHKSNPFLWAYIL